MATPMSNYNYISLTVWCASFFNNSNTTNVNYFVIGYSNSASLGSLLINASLLNIFASDTVNSARQFLRNTIKATRWLDMF